MAAADYLLCSNCYHKAVYDAEVDYSTPSLGSIAALCTNCTEAGYKIIITDPTTTTEENP